MTFLAYLCNPRHHTSVSTFIFLFSNFVLPLESVILYMSEGFRNREVVICREHIASVSKQEAESTASSVAVNMKIGFLPRSVASSVSGRLSWLRSTSHQCCRYLTTTLSTCLLSHCLICGAPNFVQYLNYFSSLFVLQVLICCSIFLGNILVLLLYKVNIYPNL